MFILIPTCANSDCMAMAWANDVESRSVEVIAVNVKPLAWPPAFRYFLALAKFCVGQIADTGFEAYGPSGTGPNDLALTVHPRRSESDYGSSRRQRPRRKLALWKMPVVSWSCNARYERFITFCTL